MAGLIVIHVCIVSSSECFEIVPLPCSDRLDYNTSSEGDTLSLDWSVNTCGRRCEIKLNNITDMITLTCLSETDVVWKETFNLTDYVPKLTSPNIFNSTSPNIFNSTSSDMNSSGYKTATIVLSVFLLPMFCIGFSIGCVCAHNRKFRRMIGVCRKDAQQKTDLKESTEENGLTLISSHDNSYSLVADEEQVLNNNNRNVIHQNARSNIEMSLSSSDIDLEELVKKNGRQTLDSIESHDHC